MEKAIKGKENETNLDAREERTKRRWKWPRKKMNRDSGAEDEHEAPCGKEEECQASCEREEECQAPWGRIESRMEEDECEEVAKEEDEKKKLRKKKMNARKEENSATTRAYIQSPSDLRSLRFLSTL